MISCWKHRRALAEAVDAGTRPPTGAREHLERCPRCREQYQSENRLAARLAADAASVRQSPPPFLHGKIMSSVRSAGTAPARIEHRFRWGWSFAIAAACLVFTVSGLWLHQHWKERRSKEELGIRMAALTSEVASVIKLPSGAHLRDWSAKLDEPLQNEMKLVLNDTKSAVDFLAANVIPERFRSSLFDLRQD